MMDICFILMLVCAALEKWEGALIFGGMTILLLVVFMCAGIYADKHGGKSK